MASKSPRSGITEEILPPKLRDVLADESFEDFRLSLILAESSESDSEEDEEFRRRFLRLSFFFDRFLSLDFLLDRFDSSSESELEKSLVYIRI